MKVFEVVVKVECTCYLSKVKYVRILTCICDAQHSQA